MLLLLFKFIAGFVGHSAAMMADAIHSLSDFVTDVIVLLFVRISGKPQDKSHDYGHAKYETLAMTLIGVALLLVAVGIVYNGVVAIHFWAKGGQLAAYFGFDFSVLGKFFICNIFRLESLLYAAGMQTDRYIHGNYY